MPPREQRTAARINEDIAARARDGLWGHPVCLGLVFLTTSFLEDHPLEMTTLAGIFAVLFIVRMKLLDWTDRTGAWRPLMQSVLMLSAAHWGFFLAWSVYVYGYHHPNTIPLLIYHAAIAVVGTPSFLHSFRLTKVYLLILFVPPSVSHAFFPDSQRGAAIWAFIFYSTFLLLRSHRLCRDYARRLDEHIGLSAKASSDPLTGLPNRLAMRQTLAEAMEEARRNSGRLAFLFIDLDGFKAINDQYSHRVGDLFLCDVADRLGVCGGGSGQVARLGGDEFTIMLWDDSIALDIAQDVLSAVRQSVTIEGHQCAVTASVGISFFPDDAETEDDLIRAADHAMYEAKRTGANQICFAGTRRHQAMSLSVNSPSPLTSVSRISRP